MFRRGRLLRCAALLAAGIACGRGDTGDSPAPQTRSGEPDESGAEPTLPPQARWDLVEMLRAGEAQPVHPADGGGRAWLETAGAGPVRVQASSPARFDLAYEVGPLGIATGGAVLLQVSPFWGWSTPQVEDPGAPGYTQIEASAPDIEWSAATLDQQLLGIRITGRPLVAGEQLRIGYGAGTAGARCDRYAESDSRFWFSVDGDGDGVRAVLPDSPGVEVVAGPPAQLVVTLPTTVHPGERFPVAVAVLDAVGNAGAPLAGDVVFEDVPAGVELPERVALEAGVARAVATASQPGILRLRAVGPGGLAGEGNPLEVSDGPRILWGDLHGHSGLSDGTGTPGDYLHYARDVAALDVVALTDHDHWGMLPLAQHPELWEEIARETRAFHEPGRFVTLLGYEWTSWIHGHRHVLYFGDEGPVFSSLDPDFESPLQLWQALEGRPALTFAHHSAGGPIATNWEIPPDPRFEPVTEIASVHGSSEALDSPRLIFHPVPGNFVRDALGRGYRLGFIGSGDTHDGHPGLGALASPSGGLAAILSEERTREGVLDALRARRVYATNGPRILLRAALGPHRMGSLVDLPEGGSASEELFVRVVAPAPLERVDLIRSGEIVDSAEAGELRELTLSRRVEDLRAGEYVYVRAVQSDGGAAWSSPVYFY